MDRIWQKLRMSSDLKNEARRACCIYRNRLMSLKAHADDINYDVAKEREKAGTS